MPRAYRMGERVAQMEATRGRIIETAIELYEQLGISSTTMSLVALRADVAPGTLRRHFATRDDLDRAMIDHLTAEAPLPELSIFDGADSLEERLGRLIRATGTFLDQSRRLQQMWTRERLLSQPWAEVGAAYGARWADLVAGALGPLVEDPDASALIRAVLTPSFFEGIRAGERTTEEAATLITAAVAPWFTLRAGGRARRVRR